MEPVDLPGLCPPACVLFLFPDTLLSLLLAPLPQPGDEEDKDSVNV